MSELRLPPGNLTALPPVRGGTGAVFGNCGHDRFVPLGAGVGRVVEELRRSLDVEVAQAPADVPVQVGSEADLAAQPRLDLAVAVDPDGLILGTHFRASEEALRVLARLAGKVDGRGARCLLANQPARSSGFRRPEEGRSTPVPGVGTRGPGPIWVSALGRADHPRSAGSLPDGSEVWVKDAGRRSDGPRSGRPGRRAVRWLIQGPDLTKVRNQLRPLVQRWRDSGVAVRVDVDPIEL